MTEPYDTIIIGGGPAGAAAAVYAARKKLKTMLIAEDFGGQSLASASIENWIGEISISGRDLAEKLEKHVRAQPDVEIRLSERVTGVREGADCLFEVSSDQGGKYHAKTVIVATGGRRKRLNVPGKTTPGPGSRLFSTCDAPFSTAWTWPWWAPAIAPWRR